MKSDASAASSVPIFTVTLKRMAGLKLVTMETDVTYCWEGSTTTDLREERGMSETRESEEMLKEGKHEQKGERTRWSMRPDASSHRYFSVIYFSPI